MQETLGSCPACLPNSGSLIPNPPSPKLSSHLLTDMSATHGGGDRKELFIGRAGGKQCRTRGKAGVMEGPGCEVRVTKRLIPNEQPFHLSGGAPSTESLGEI